jgi:hypothetical protein
MARFKKLTRPAQTTVVGSGTVHTPTRIVWVNIDGVAWVEPQVPGLGGKTRLTFLVTDKSGQPETLAVEESPEDVIAATDREG